MSEVQSILFDKDLFSLDEMEKWLKKRGFKHNTHRQSLNYVRWRQFAPPKKVTYRMIRATKGVIFVLALSKPQ